MVTKFNNLSHFYDFVANETTIDYKIQFDKHLMDKKYNYFFPCFTCGPVEGE